MYTYMWCNHVYIHVVQILFPPPLTCKQMKVTFTLNSWDWITNRYLVIRFVINYHQLSSVVFTPHSCCTCYWYCMYVLTINTYIKRKCKRNVHQWLWGPSYQGRNTQGCGWWQKQQLSRPRTGHWLLHKQQWLSMGGRLGHYSTCTCHTVTLTVVSVWSHEHVYTLPACALAAGATGDHETQTQSESWSLCRKNTR